MAIARRARAIRNQYFEAGCTQAELQGITLMKEWLSPEQLASPTGILMLLVSQSGKRYRIRYGVGMNIYEVDSRGKRLTGLCFVPSETLVAGDVMLAQKISLESDESSALSVARRFVPIWQ